MKKICSLTIQKPIEGVGITNYKKQYCRLNGISSKSKLKPGRKLRIK